MRFRHWNLVVSEELSAAVRFHLLAWLSTLGRAFYTCAKDDALSRGRQRRAGLALLDPCRPSPSLTINPSQVMVRFVGRAQSEDNGWTYTVTGSHVVYCDAIIFWVDPQYCTDELAYMGSLTIP